MKLILALDQGTTSSRAVLFQHSGEAVAVAQKEFRQYFPGPGRVEHDAAEVWSSQLAVARSVLRKAGVTWRDVAAIGVANQRETTVVWNRDTGQPVSPAIVWQDRRTAEFCRTLKSTATARMIRSRTGLIPDPYFSGTKLRWILRNVRSADKLASAGRLAFGTVDSWLLWNLTEGRLHVTDPGNASRTMLFNIRTGQWDRKLCELLDIPMSLLPEVRSSSEVFGETRLLGGRIPIGGVAGDQQAALFGQCCFRPGMIKNTYGTGCFLLMNTGDVAVKSENQLLTTIAWNIEGRTQYALEGSVFIAGAVVQWLRDQLGIVKSAEEIEALARSVPSTEGVCFVPAFTGLGSPYWDPWVRGTLVGLTRGTTKAHLARAALEGIAFQVFDVVSAMQADAGVKLRQLRVDGGASLNDFLMQFQADLLRVSVVRPRVSETTALGAACLAGLAVGFWKDEQQISKNWHEARLFRPRARKAAIQQDLKRWQRAVAAAREFAAGASSGQD